MQVYEFLKNRTPVNVSFDIAEGIIRFAPPVDGSRWYMDSREAFADLYGQLLDEYIDRNGLEKAYTVLFIDRKNNEYSDLIRLYGDWEECSKAIKGHENIYRTCYRDDIKPFITSFMFKDFTASRIDRQWYFSDKNNREKAEKITKPAAEGEQLTLFDVPEPVHLTKKQQKTEDINRKCRENGIDPGELPPWEDVDSFIARKKQKKADEDNLVTVHMTLKKTDLDKILSSYEVTIIGGTSGKAENEVFFEREKMDAFFAELNINKEKGSSGKKKKASSGRKKKK